MKNKLLEVLIASLIGVDDSSCQQEFRGDDHTQDLSRIDTRASKLLDSRTLQPIEVTSEKNESYRDTIRKTFYLSLRGGEYALLVDKVSRTAYLLNAGQVDTTFAIALGFNPVGDKLYKSDGRTPEGIYRVDWVRDGSRANSSVFGLALHLNYPTSKDVREFLEGKQKGLVPDQIDSAGGNIEVHAGSDFYDWTAGCVAIKKEGMEKLVRKIKNGNYVGIVGFIPEGLDFNNLDL